MFTSRSLTSTVRVTNQTRRRETLTTCPLTLHWSARGLENLVAHMQAQLALEQARYTELLSDVRAVRLALPTAARRPWWKTWGRA